MVLLNQLPQQYHTTHTVFTRTLGAYTQWAHIARRKEHLRRTQIAQHTELAQPYALRNMRHTHTYEQPRQQQQQAATTTEAAAAAGAAAATQ